MPAYTAFDRLFDRYWQLRDLADRPGTSVSDKLYGQIEALGWLLEVEGDEGIVHLGPVTQRSEYPVTVNMIVNEFLVACYLVHGNRSYLQRIETQPARRLPDRSVPYDFAVGAQMALGLALRHMGPDVSGLAEDDL